MRYKPLAEPWEHQREALAKMRGRRAFALHLGTRCGKTLTALTDFATTLVELQAVDDLLVVAPAAYYETWSKALARDLHPVLYKRLAVLVWTAKDTKAHQTELFLRIHDQPRVLIVDVEALANVVRARNLCERFVRDRRCMVIVDESVTIKNPKSRAKRAKFVVNKLGYGNSAFRRTLSGLPTPRAPDDIFRQFAFLDPNIIGVPNHNAFLGRYAILKKSYFAQGVRREVVGWRNLDHLKACVDPHSFQVDLDANKIYERVDVTLTAEQQRIYDELRAYAHAELDDAGTVTVGQVITQILRLHQVVCGHVKNDAGELIDLPENRTKALVRALRQVDGKAVVWVAYDRDVHKVTEALSKEFRCCVARFWGGNRSTRLIEEGAFLNDPDFRFMVATPAAAKFGREWRCADTAVFFTNTDNLGDRVQAEARILAFDKDEPSTYVDLVAKGTVEEKIIRNLRKKLTLSTQVDGRNWKVWL